MAEKSWKKAGALTSKKEGAKNPEVVTVTQNYVVIGFEVNFPEAFKDSIHILDVDYGHAFFYVVNQSKISRLLSFGPNGAGTVSAINPLKDGYKNSRPGTPDYPISEATKLFRIKLTSTQTRILEAETDKVRKKIIAGDAKYSALVNDTCAETAREVLSAASISTPSARGKVAVTTASVPKPELRNDFPYVGIKNENVRVVVASADNPYMWHHNFKKEGHKEVTRPALEWPNLIGMDDPLISQW